MTLITLKIAGEGTLGNEVVILHIKVLLQRGYYVNKNHQIQGMDHPEIQ